jgi:hypothetical protein
MVVSFVALYMIAFDQRIRQAGLVSTRAGN